MHKTFFKSDLYPKKEKVYKQIPKVSEKKKERIKQNGSEAKLFLEIWHERPHICYICWNNIPEPKQECFSHKLWKWRYPALRYNKKNIEIVCSSICHKEHDRINAWNDFELIQEILWLQ